ncbi:hypothetical protein SALBM311S_06981 [Streptomyces alboniger]
MTGAGGESFIGAVKPLVDAMGGEILAPDEAGPDDVVLSWEGAEVVAVRLPQLADSLDHILAALERKKGKPLADLDRKAKQEVVRMLEVRGAFSGAARRGNRRGRARGESLHRLQLPESATRGLSEGLSAARGFRYPEFSTSVDAGVAEGR